MKRIYNFFLTACVMMLVLSSSGCEKLAVETYNMENYCTGEDASLYSFTEQFADLENIVATEMYGEDSILLYEELLEGNTLNKKVWLFSYVTGEREVLSDFTLEVEPDYMSSPDRFEVLSAAPFVLLDVYGGEIHIYKDDFSAYSTVAFEEYTMPNGMFVRNGKLYVMDFFTGKVYAHDLDDYRNSEVKMTYKTFREEAVCVFVPDFSVGNCSLEEVSNDGNFLRIFAECQRENEYYYYIYNIETQEFEEKYRFEDERYTLWTAWDYGKDLEMIQPSAVDRFRFTDYASGKAYETKIEPKVVYSYVKWGKNISEKSDKILFYVVDENDANISEVFVWDYTKASGENADRQSQRIVSEIPEEIDYEHLTQRAEALEEKYGLNIIMGENVTCDFEAYEYNQVVDEVRIAYALDELEKAMEAFPDGMCEEMAADYALGFNVYLCGKFSPANKENISDAGAFFTFDNGYYNLAMDINLDNLESNLIHEMTHAIDEYFVYCGAYEQLEEDWKACNPEGFTYLESYFGYEGEYEYTFYDDFDDINEVYFVDEYAKTFPTEDRSRVFENFGSEYNEGVWLLESQPLRRKARLLLDYCKEYMDCFNTDEEYGLKEKAEELGW